MDRKDKRLRRSILGNVVTTRSSLNREQIVQGGNNDQN